MKILVCDDDELILSLIKRILTGENMGEISFAEDGLQGLEMLAQHEFDVIITDIHMPYHNGDEILEFVRQKQKRSTPIIMLSSDSEEEIVVLARKQGVNIFLQKPVKPELLIKSIRSLVP